MSSQPFKLPYPIPINHFYKPPKPSRKSVEKVRKYENLLHDLAMEMRQVNNIPYWANLD